jgi:hypothetical protein
MIRLVHAAVLMCATALVLPAFGGIGVPERSAFVLSGNAGTGWEIGFTYRPVQSTTVDISGTSHRVFLSPSAEGEPGIPQLPYEAFSIGIPPGTTIRVRLLDAEYETMAEQDIAPAPEYTMDGEGNATPAYSRNAAVYAQDRFFPSDEVVIESSFMLRKQRIATVRVAPYRYNPAQRLLKRLVRGRVVVSLEDAPYSPANAVQTGAHPDPHFEHVYKSILLNYEEARQWRIVEPSKPIHPIDSTRAWFETGRTYYKIPIAADGWYRVTKADLIAAGANPSTIDVPSLKMFRRGLEIPLLVRPDTTIEFHARKNYGDSTYIDFYTDTSAYWLTWGGTAGRRFADAAQPSGTPTLDVRSAPVVVHFEQNRRYYVGTSTDEIINNATIPGEGWLWHDYYPNTQYTYPVPLDSPGVAASARIRARMFGVTTGNPPIQHHARFWLNDSLAGEVMFPQRTEAILDVAVPLDWLRVGSNTLTIRSIPTATPVNQFYLDWFEVTYDRILRAVDDLLVFQTPASSGGGPATFSVTGFTDPQIDVLDLTTGRRLAGVTVWGDSLSGFGVTFQDTLSYERTYVAVSAAGAGSPPALQGKMFADIRANPQGSDYIVITHPLFMQQAAQLAAHRAATNGVRTRVVSVYDIYDEFNYGVFNATVIKSFLHYAYTTWPAPAPAYVLFFGDASWDYHRYMSTATKTNYVPAYGVPAGDNWYACFDPVFRFLPSMLIGRIPVENQTQAASMLAKVAGYDAYQLEEWNKNFLLITGGNGSTEQAQFNALAENVINTHITSSPVGGTAYRAYKSSHPVIDGEHREPMRALVKNGLIFINFLGHSGGRIWNVDIGPPAQLENTNGKLPFLSSVSCNVGAFADPSSNVLAEDFIMADNRGAIASWASSSLGFPLTGTSLVNHFLNAVRVDSMRDFGGLTTTARFRLWQTTGTTSTVVAMVNLNPLLGDPLSRLAIPLKPDLAVHADNVVLDLDSPSATDSTINIAVKFYNYGLMPTDSVEVSISDTYGGQVITLLDRVKRPRTAHRDSITLAWNVGGKIGRHAISVQLDPDNQHPEVNELNNVVSVPRFVYANTLAVVRPFNNAVTPPGVQKLIVTGPVGVDAQNLEYEFQLDTASTFDSPFFITSGLLPAADAAGEWQTPSLSAGQVYYWRARTIFGRFPGKWTTAAFSTSQIIPALPAMRWREHTRGQFQRTNLLQTTPTDSGVTIAPRPETWLYARSVGNRANPGTDFYSLLKVDDQVVTGLWWVVGNSFMATRVNDFTGEMEFKSFAVSSSPANGDSMRNFINNTPPGFYIALTVIFDGRTNVSESLYVAIESLGATMIRQVLAGHSWCLIGRKGVGGPGMPALEEWSPDGVAEVEFTLPNEYSYGSGSVASSGLAISPNWQSFHWRRSLTPGMTDIAVALLGLRADGGVDTLRVLPADSTDISLGFLNTLTAGNTYVSLRPSAVLTTSDPVVTPVLQEWWIDMEPPGDLAISQRTIGTPVPSQTPGLYDLPVIVHNLGYRTIDSGQVSLALYDVVNRLHQAGSAQFGQIAPGRFTSVLVPFAAPAGQFSVKVTVTPSSTDKDLVAENNIAHATFGVRAAGPILSDIQVFADGLRIMDGDYISPTPSLHVRLTDTQQAATATSVARFFVNGRQMEEEKVAGRQQSGAVQELVFEPELESGSHELMFEVLKINTSGQVDTVQHTMRVNVRREVSLMQVYNYPNPFRNDTQFTFVLTGARVPAELVIGVFTVGGRKIREIVVPGSELQIGFNRVYWDGRDGDGDEIANGYYFYQIATRGDGPSVRVVEKLAKVR